MYAGSKEREQIVTHDECPSEPYFGTMFGIVDARQELFAKHCDVPLARNRVTKLSDQGPNQNLNINPATKKDIRIERDTHRFLCLRPVVLQYMPDLFLDGIPNILVSTGAGWDSVFIVIGR